jgi:hypothetical protein
VSDDNLYRAWRVPLTNMGDKAEALEAWANSIHSPGPIPPPLDRGTPSKPCTLLRDWIDIQEVVCLATPCRGESTP